jgi:hypothetical protein
MGNGTQALFECEFHGATPLPPPLACGREVMEVSERQRQCRAVVLVRSRLCLPFVHPWSAPASALRITSQYYIELCSPPLSVYRAL